MMTPLLCKSGVRQLVLDTVKELRPSSGIRRIGDDYFQRLHARVHAMVVGDVKSAPSKATLK